MGIYISSRVYFFSGEKVVGLSGKLELKAENSEEDEETWPEGQPIWSSDKGGVFDPPKGPKTVWTPSKASEAIDDVKIDTKCGSASESTHKVTVIKIKEVKYFDPNGAEKVVPNPFYVAGGSKVKFKAIPHLNVPWPKETPEWGGEASGKKPEVEVEFSLAAGDNAKKEEEKSISVTSGNTLTHKVIVCPVPSVTLEPGEDYAVTVSKKIVPYDVTGLTNATISKSLGNPPFGQTETFLDWPGWGTLDLQTTEGYKVTIITGKIDPDDHKTIERKIRMPKWIDKGKSKDDALKKKWDAFYESIEKHENNHVKIHEKYSSKVMKLLNKGKFKAYLKEKDLKKLQTLLDKKIDEHVTNLESEHNNEQKAYDRTSEDGRKEGAVW